MIDDDHSWPPPGVRVNVGQDFIRRYEPGDREAVRDICRTTAYRNRGFQRVFEDGEVFADYWTRYYTDFEPESCLVCVVDGSVAGYMAGCLDTRRFRRIMALRIVPPVAARIAFAAISRRYVNPVTYRLLKWTLTRAGREEVNVPLDLYPAHYHSNISKRALGRGLYSRMTTMFLNLLDTRGVAGVHGKFEEPERQGAWLRTADAVGRRPRFFAETPNSLYADVLGFRDRKMVNRAWGDTPQGYQLFLDAIAKRLNL